MSRIVIWRGFRGPETSRLLEAAWREDALLILVPPKLEIDYSFVSKLPEGKLDWVGDWSDACPIQSSGGATYPEKPVYGIFTSGTTGSAKKLVLYSKRNIVSCLSGIRSFFDEKRIAQLFCYPQPFHTFGLNLGHVQSLHFGAKLTAPLGTYREAFHESWYESLTNDQITLGTPTHFKDLIAWVKKNGLTPKESYSCIIGGAQVETLLWWEIRNTLNIQEPSIGYGATEASPGITHLPPGQAPKEDGEVGVLLPQLKVSLEPEGIRFRGPNVCLATIENNTLSFPHEYVLPDQLEKRSDGMLVYKGRLNLVLNRGGEKFELEKLERTLREKLGVQSICVSTPDSRLGEELGVLIKRSGSSRREEIFEQLAETFGRSFDEERFIEVEQFPVNLNGKPDRKACARLLEGR